MILILCNDDEEVCGQLSNFLQRDKFTLEIIPYPVKLCRDKVAVVKDDSKIGTPPIERPAESCRFVELNYEEERIIDFIVDKLIQSNFKPINLREIKNFPGDLLKEIEDKYDEKTS